MESNSVERATLCCLFAIIILAIVMMFACAYFMTVGTDEAWVLMGIRSCFEPIREGFSSHLIFTSGGVFTIVQSLVTLIVADSIFVHRLFPLFSMLAVFAISGSLVCGQSLTRCNLYTVLIPAVLLIGIPGTLIVGTTALGTAPAFLLLLLASRYWFSTEGRRPSVVIAGLLFGLAAATRMDVVMFAPALIVHAVIFPRTSRPKAILEALVVALIGIAILFANQRLHGAFNAVPPVDTNTGTSTGVSGNLLDYPRLLNKFLIANSMLPLGVIVAISLLVFHRFGEKQDRHWQSFLVCFGIIAWAAWVVRAPIPHIRYLWPSLASFGVLAGINLARLCTRENASVWLRVFCVGVSVGFAFDGLGTTFRHLVCGQSDFVAWEYSREVGIDYYQRFQQRMDETKISSFLRESTSGKDVFVVGPPFRYRYLGGVPCFKMTEAREGQRESILLLGPEVGTFIYLRPSAYQLIEETCTPVAEIGEYSAFRIESVSDLLATEPFVRAGYYAHPHSKPWFGMP